MGASPLKQVRVWVGNSGRRNEGVKIPLIGWEGNVYRKDARCWVRFGVKIPNLNRVKFPVGFCGSREPVFIVPVPEGRLRVAQDAVLGTMHITTKSPARDG